MFKFDDSEEEQPQKEVYSTKRSLEKKRKVPGIGIKITNQSMEENKPNINNRRKIDVVSSNTKSQENNERIATGRGIQVMSSRQGSSEKRQLTSRSR